MKTVGGRALKQNASAVVADAAAGEIVTITDRGRAVAQLIPLPASRLLLRTELLRTTLRGAPDEMPRARRVLDSITILTLPTSLVEGAAELEPTLLRSLDAVHLAAALDLGDELDSIITYDDRLAEAAKLHGVQAIAPT